MFTGNIKTSGIINIYYQSEISEGGPISSEKRESEISRLNRRERDITSLLRACHAEQKKYGKSKTELANLDIEIQNILTELESIRKKSAELRDQRGKILGKTSNFLRNNWNKLKDTARPLSLVSTHSEKKLEQAKVMSEAQEQEKKNMEEELKKKKNDLALLSLHQNPLLIAEKKPENINSIPTLNTIDLSKVSEDAKEIVEKKIDAVLKIEKITAKKQEEVVKSQESKETNLKQDIKTKKTNEMFTEIIDALPESEQKEFIDILRKGLTNEEESILDSSQDDDESLQKKIEIYTKVYSNVTKHVGGEFLEQFKKSKSKDTPLGKEIEIYLNQKNPERDANQAITDSDIESLKNDTSFLQIFMANATKIDEYKVPEGTYEGIFDKNISTLLGSVNGWYSDNMQLIGTALSHNKDKMNEKETDAELDRAMRDADEADRELFAKKEDMIRQIGHLESDIASTDAILESINLCRSTGQDSSLNGEDINSMTLDSERPMICFDHHDTPVLYFINKKGERTMIMLFSDNNPITLTGSPTEIKKQMDMVVEIQKYPIFSSFVHTPRLLSETYDACRSRYPEKDPKDPSNQILIKFILESIYGAAGMDIQLTSENIGSEMNHISQDSSFAKNIKSELIAGGFFDPMSGRINDRILSSPNPPDLSLV